MNQLVKVSLNDFRLIFRDPSLSSFLGLPVIIYAVVIWLLPYLVNKYDFLVPYVPLLMIVFIIENTQAFCFISSMVLIEEKETGVAKVYGILPVSKVAFTLARMIIPYLLTVLLNIFLLAVQPFFDITLLSNIAISVVAGLVVPVYALALNVIVKNKIEGMVYVKVFNILVLVPLAAFFLPERFKHFFGIFPTHWVFQGANSVLSHGQPVFFLLAAFVFLTALLAWISRLFVKRHFE